MRTKRPIKKTYKNLKGIIIPQPSYVDPLALLTSEGKTIPIVQNEKFNFLKNLIWESVIVFGRIIKVSHKEMLEVIFFSSSTPPDLIMDDSDAQLNSQSTWA
jgi:hypothetical protein